MSNTNILLWILSCVIAYCLGSISVGILVAKRHHGPDLRAVGSKSTGASNVQRTMGWKYGLITFVGDFLKALLAWWLGELITGSHHCAMLCGLMAVLGHNWPIFFGFKGGKGVASSCGIMIYCFPIPALIGYAVAIIAIAITKFISVGSMSMLVVYAILVSCFWSGGDLWIILWAIAMASLCLIRHHANIGRLIRGEENKLGNKVSVSKKP